MAAENEDGFVNRNRRQRRLFGEINTLGTPDDVLAVDRARRSTGGTTELGDAIRNQYNAELGGGRAPGLFGRGRRGTPDPGTPSRGIAGVTPRPQPSGVVGPPSAPSPLQRFLAAAGGFALEQVGKPVVESILSGAEAPKNVILAPLTGSTPLESVQNIGRALTGERFSGRDIGGIRLTSDKDIIGSLSVRDILGGTVDIVTEDVIFGGPLRTLATRGLRLPGRAIAADIARIESAQISALPRGDATSSVVGRLTARLNELTPIRAETEALKTTELGQRAGRMVAAEGRAATSEEAFFAARAQQAGALPKAEIPSLADEFGGAEIEDLLGQIDRVFQTDAFKRQNVKESLLNMLGRLGDEGGSLPTSGQLDDLEQVFGRDFADAVGELAKLNPSLRQDALDALGIPRAVLSSFDFSAPGRQGIVFIGRKEFWQNLLPGLKALKSKEFAERMDDVHRGFGFAEDSAEGAAAAVAREAGLDLPRASARRGGLTTVEEGFQTSVPERIPGIKWVWDQFVGRSQRAYTTYLNGVRRGVFDNTANKWQRWVDDGTFTQEQMTANLDEMANWINIGTGRANLSPEVARSPWLVAANRLFFAPRLVISRFQALARGTVATGDVALRTLAGGPPASPVNKEIARDFVSFISAGSGALTMGHQFGWIDVSLDPSSSDFGKGRAGTTRYDPWGGMQQTVRFIMNLATAAASGDKDEFFKVAGRFLKSKAEPGVVGVLIDIENGATFVGEPVGADLETLGIEARNRLVPLSLQDIWEGFEQEGLIGGIKATPGIVGIGVSSFESTQQLRERFGIITEGPNKTEPAEVARIIAENPELEAELARRNQQSARAGNEGAQRAVDNAQNREVAKGKQVALDDALQLWRDGQPGGMPPKQWRSVRSDNQTFERGQSSALFLHADFSGKEKDARDAYREIIESAELPTGQPDWDAVDAALAELPQEDQDFIIRNTGITDTPTEREYREFLGEFKAAGGFEWGENAWAVIQRDSVGTRFEGAVSGFESYSDWLEAAVIENLPGAARELGMGLNDDGSLPSDLTDEAAAIIRSHAESRTRNRDEIAKAYALAISREKTAFEEGRAATETRPAQIALPDLIARANSWGIVSLNEIERRYLLGEISE